VLVAALLVKWSFFVVMAIAKGVLSTSIFAFIAWAGFELLRTLVEIYFWGIFILVVFSWVGTPPHPAAKASTSGNLSLHGSFSSVYTAARNDRPITYGGYFFADDHSRQNTPLNSHANQALPDVSQ
jgi:hypothetical protein